MLLVLSITFYFHYDIWGCMCSTGPFKYRWLKGYTSRGYTYSSCYYHHQIGSIHLSHCFHIFPRLCAWDVCYIIFCHLLHIHSGKTGDLFSLVLCSLWSSANSRIRFGLEIVDLSRSGRLKLGCVVHMVITYQCPNPKSGLTNPWWRHQMEIFSALLAICAWNSPVTGEFTAQRPVTRSFDVVFDLRLNKRLSKQWWGWWFETPSCPLWRHRNALSVKEVTGWLTLLNWDSYASHDSC